MDLQGVLDFFVIVKEFGGLNGMGWDGEVVRSSGCSKCGPLTVVLEDSLSVNQKSTRGSIKELFCLPSTPRNEYSAIISQGNKNGVISSHIFQNAQITLNKIMHR